MHERYDTVCGARVTDHPCANTKLIGDCPFISDRQRLYQGCRSDPAMVINAIEISLSDPGAVPGASTNSPRRERSLERAGGLLMGAK